MKKRKKFHGGLKLLLVLLFTLLLSTFSTCYANVSEEYIQYCFDTISTYSVHTVTNTDYSERNRTWIKLFADSNSAITDVTNKINSFLQENNISALQDVNCICVTNSQNTMACNVFFIFSNVSSPYGISNLDFVEFGYSSSELSQAFYPHYMNSSDKIYFARFTIQNNLVYKFSTKTLTDDVQSITKATFTYNDENSTLTSTNIACCGLPSVYYKISSSLISPFIAIDPNGNYQTVTPEPEPEEPSGDTPVNPSGEGGGGSGTIDYANQLNDINNSVNTQGQAIVNQISGDTQKVVGAINSANENYWGKSGDLTGEKQEEEIENNVNEIIGSLSGDLAENQVIKMLDDAEKGFIDKFSNRDAPEQFFDLKFEWDDIKYEGITLIEAGELNISKICRENETMGVVKGYIQVIAGFAIIMNILKTIYNLILTAMGIIQPQLNMQYETPIMDKELDKASDGYMLNDTIHL